MVSVLQVACQKTAVGAGKKGDDLAKNFSSQRGGLPLHFLQMNHPGRIVEMGFFNPRLSRTAICNHRPVSPDTL
jgi:hypothetical protein